jgi:hypothetical protein
MRAISIRQPWAWAIVYAGKDVENRSYPARFNGAVGQRIGIHASRTWERAEWAEAVAFMERLGIACPCMDQLDYGGLIGSALVTDIVTSHRSHWFKGPAALVLADARPEPFTPCKGNASLFHV